MSTKTSLKFKEGSYVVYPSHGVGEVTGIESQTVAGMTIDTYVIKFSSQDMILRVPVSRAEKSGLRFLSSENEIEDMNKSLRQKPKSGKGMWSRRAKDYDAKINSGNIVYLAEVVRDLHKNVKDPDRSYSERIIYEDALERLAREYSAVKSIDVDASQKYIVSYLNEKNPYFVKKALEEKVQIEEAKALAEANEEISKNKKAPKKKATIEVDDEALAA